MIFGWNLIEKFIIMNQGDNFFRRYLAEGSIVETLSAAETVALPICRQCWHHHEIDFRQIFSEADWLTHSQGVGHLIAGKQNPFQILAANAWHEKFNAFVELAVLQEDIGIRFVTERNVASNFFCPELPRVVN